MSEIKKHKKWTEEQDAYFVGLKTSGKENKDIPGLMQAMFGFKFSERECKERYRMLKGNGQEWDPNYDSTLLELYKLIGPKWEHFSNIFQGMPVHRIKKRFYKLVKNQDYIDTNNATTTTLSSSTTTSQPSSLPQELETKQSNNEQTEQPQFILYLPPLPPTVSNQQIESDGQQSILPTLNSLEATNGVTSEHVTNKDFYTDLTSLEKDLNEKTKDQNKSRKL